MRFVTSLCLGCIEMNQVDIKCLLQIIMVIGKILISKLIEAVLILAFMDILIPNRIEIKSM